MTLTYRPQTGASAMEIQPAQSALGAYVTGIDLRNLSDTAFAALRQAWLDHLVIVVRGQQLTDDDLTAFSARFGVLDEVPPVGTGQKPRDNRHVSVISNLLEKGVPIGGLGDDEVIWHSDTSYRDCPPSASVLHALEIPPAGGDTSFANMYLALETLPRALRERIDALTVKNDTTYNAGGQLREGFAPVTDVRACPGATHPLVRTHPETRCDALYLGRRRNAYIHGLALEESEALLDALWSHATQENLVWHHTWRVGDVAIWDNRCTMHHRDPFDAHARRVMHRAQARDGRRPAREPSAGRAAHPRGQRYLSAGAASATDAAPMAISIRPLSPVFGAEITGVDLARVDDATFAQIEDAFETYSVLVFPGQNLDKDSQIAFSRRFGELETTQGHIGNNFTVSHVSVISNLDPDGRLMSEDDPRVQFRVGQRNWHSDSSFKRVPAKASLLYARVLPPDGGETQFASLRAAYDALPADGKRKLEGQVAIHHYAYSRRGMNIKLTNDEEDRRFPPVPQAIIRSNPRNGRKALYVGSHASHIRGLPEDEGRAWLAELLEFATREDFTYLHRWKVGDLVMYDNRAVLHRARPYAITAHPRVLHRTTVAGEGPTAQ